MIKCGWASIDEKGKAHGGKAGNQSGKELKVGNWYSFGQTTVYRFKDRKKAKKYADWIKKACNNKNIGYDQYQRTTLYTQLKKVDFDLTKVKIPCECDCSTLVSAGLNAVGINVPYDWRTATIPNYILETGEFTKLTDSKYINGSDYLMTGDIINRPAHHVITALEDGRRAEVKIARTEREEVIASLQKALNKDYNTSLVVDGKYGPATTNALKSHNIKKGSKKYTVDWLQKQLRKHNFKDQNNVAIAIDGDFGSKTLYATKRLQKYLGLKSDGEFGTGTFKKYLDFFYD